MYNKYITNELRTHQMPSMFTHEYETYVTSFPIFAEKYVKLSRT